MRLSLKQLVVISFVYVCVLLVFMNYHFLMSVRTDSEGQESTDIFDFPVWPEDKNSSDRILEQLELDMDHIAFQQYQKQHPVDQYEKIHSISSSPKVIYLPRGLRSWHVEGKQAEFTKQQCKISNCFLSDRKLDARRADAIIFRDRYEPEFKRIDPHQIWIFYALESPEYIPTLRLLKDQINWTASFRSDSDLVVPYGKFRSFTEEELISRKVTQRQQISHARNKTKQAVWFASSCATTNHRREYVQELQQHIQVDIYGRCGKQRCAKRNPNCAGMLDKDYRFYLAFENSNCRDYITEKFFVLGLQHDIIPVVMGAPKIDYLKVASPHSFIHVDDFGGPAELADYLHFLSQNETSYNEYFRWKNSGEFVNTKFWCRLCAMLHIPRKLKHYPDIDQWWHGSNSCRYGRREM